MGVSYVPISMEGTNDPSDRPTELSDLQVAILQHFAAGRSSVQVARTLAISEATMRRNLQEARQALNATNTAQAIYIAVKAGLI